jgi:Domain of unknown function (DUF4124)
MLRPAAMLRPVALTTLIVAGLCGVAHADVYRWVDDKGEPHYSDRWVPGSELIKSNKPHPVTPDSSAGGPQDQNKAVNNAAQSATDKIAQKANADAVKQDVAKTRDAQCKQAKQRYQQAIEARRLYKTSKPDDTDRVYMSDAETDAYRAQARAEVIDACGSPPPAAQPQSETPSEKPEQ